MSLIKINISTENESGDISIDMKAECTLNELEVATGYLMGALASQSTTGVNVLEELLKDIKNAERTNDTAQDN